MRRRTRPPKHPEGTILTTLKILAALVASALTGAHASDLTGTPWTGDPPVVETTAQIMERDASERAFAILNRYYRRRPEEHGKGEGYYKNRPQNPAAPEVSVWTDEQVAEADRPTPKPRLPQTVGLTFDGTTLAETGAVPPDSMGAVGPTQYLLGVNARIKVFDKQTGALGPLNADTDVFFASVLTPTSGTFTSDPRVRFDRFSQRWFVVMIDVPGGSAATSNRVLIAVSDGPIITSTTTWRFYQFRVDQAPPAGEAGWFGDYPTLGLDQHALYIGIDMFGNPSGYSTTAFVVRKAVLLAGQPLVVTAFRSLTAGNVGPVSPQGVDNFDANPTFGYLIGADYGFFGRLAIRRISNPGGTPSISSNLFVDVPTTAFPIKVPHKGYTGTTGKLDPSDDRLFMAQMRNGVLWTTHTVGVTSAGVASSSATRDALRWYSLTTLNTTPTLQQAGSLYDPTATNPVFAFYPSLMVSGQGHVALGFNTAGAAAYINGAVTGRLAGDAAGTLQPVTSLTASTTAYNPSFDPGSADFGRRWGDYSYTCLDPEDDMTMWTIQQYCNSANSYACRVVKLMAPPPAPLLTANPAILTAGSANVNVTITGDVLTGAGFYDPGAGFSKRLAAAFSGTGVTVNSVTYLSPSELRLNVSVAAGASGARSLAITNPDGQQVASSAGFVTIVAGLTQADVVTALQIAGGLRTATPAEVSRYDLTGDGRVSLEDAGAILRKVTTG